ncbi:MAG TPA: hypothetical protein VHK06_00665 [Candidatus Limnocylindria bacterium]|nr:hypothetical protein [Candidatus Limnocylindria bacterium]
MGPWFAPLLVVHVCLAVALLLPSVVLPFVLRRADERSPRRAERLLFAMQGTGTIAIGAGVTATGIGLLLALGPGLLAQPWLIAALALYAANLLVAAFVSRPNLRRLLGLSATGDDRAWQRRARRQRYVAYAMAAGIGAIGFLMSTKPDLW